MSTMEDIRAVNTTFDSPLVHSIAVDLAQRCQGIGVFNAIGCVILAYTAFEGFMNEFTQLAATTVFEADNSNENPYLQEHEEELIVTLRPLSLALQVAMDCRASTEYRYDLAWRLLTGTTVRKGEGVRQRLCTLSDLRNALVHMKSAQTEIELEESEAPAGFTGRWMGTVVERHESPKFLRALQGWGLMPDDHEGQRWVNRISTRQIAGWACDTVVLAARELVAKVPGESAFHERLLERSLACRRLASET